MYDKTDLKLIVDKLSVFDPDPNPQQRILSLYSAAVAKADHSILESVINMAGKNNISSKQLYEIILQSYLFVGFPRMIEAADHLNSIIGIDGGHLRLTPVSSKESEKWFVEGQKLCQKVYGEKYDILRKRVESFAPEIFRWMIYEGYGKVLSRPGLNIVDRELAIISCLIVELRERQLYSHLIGALNVGADKKLVIQVVEDTEIFSGEGSQMALKMLNKLGIN
ncbi:MAG: hypothetical protein ABIJ12_05925 [bacterium]